MQNASSLRFSERLIARHDWVAVAVLLAIGFVTGSFVDYDLSLALYDPANMYGQVLAMYGMLPLAMTFAMAGALYFKCIDRRQGTARTVVLGAMGVIMNLGALYACAHEPILGDGEPQYAAFLVHVVAAAATDVVVLRAVRGASRKAILRYACLCTFVLALEILLVNVVLKNLWGRPRMRMIAVTPDAAFQPWWVVGSDMKQQLVAAGIDKEEFRSFPSGHSASAACAMLFAALPAVKSQWLARRELFFWIPAVFMLAVCFSRIFAGAHFLTDVCAGAGITFGSFMLGVWLFYRNRVSVGQQETPERPRGAHVRA